MIKDVTIQLQLDREIDVAIEFFYRPAERARYWANPTPGSEEEWEVCRAEGVWKDADGLHTVDLTALAQSGLLNEAIQAAIDEAKEIDAQMRAEARYDALQEDRYLQGWAA